jgi:sugar fermentation stimulation protein A
VRVPIPGLLEEAGFLERPNRFLVHCRLGGSGEVVRAHLVDPGRLKELLLPGCRIWVRPEPVVGTGTAPGATVSPSPLPRRRPPRSTAWTALLVEAPDGRSMVSLHTTLPNRLVREALLAGALEELDGWALERAEVPLGRSRIDFLLRRGEERLALEVKSVTLVEDGVALFPDAVTARGARHVRELTELAGRPGWAAAILFVVQREDAASVRAAASIDPVFAAALDEARRGGVRVLARRCRVTLDGLELAEAIGWE